ncbi:Sperm motility kinase 2B [Durusdinium trenchii]|uniref:non-specific serine/threonine protein kinase n=2 Tax=Durusdinium trenchii TaxID=1381693 RepID=A0ABP0IL10_9DINO
MLWLHPIHVSVRSPTTSCDFVAQKLSSDERSRGDKMASVLAQLVRSATSKELPGLITVELAEGHLVAENLSIPLLCADVVCAAADSFAALASSPFDRLETEDGPTIGSLFAIAPRWKRMQMGFLDAFEDPRSDELWIIGASFVPGTDHMAEFQRALCKCGTLRWDIQEEFIFHRRILGRGSSSKIRLGVRKRNFWSISDQDHDVLSEDDTQISDRPVAVKLVKHPDSEADALSIVNEVRFLAAASHPNIVALLGTYCARGKRGKTSWLLALEFCNRGPLFNYVSTQGHFDLIHGQIVSAGVLSATAYLHAQQILHRDIRPQNILLDDSTGEMRPVLANFGRAALVEVEAFRPNSYCAPEILDSRLGKPGPHSDVFSVGASMLFLFTGLERFGEVASVTWQPSLTGNASVDEIASSKLTAGLADFLLRLLAHNGRKRPSAAEACKLLVVDAPEGVQESLVVVKAMAALPVGKEKAIMPMISENFFEDADEEGRRLEEGDSRRLEGTHGYAPQPSGPGYAKLPPGTAPSLIVPPSSPPATPSPRKSRSFLSSRLRGLHGTRDDPAAAGCQSTGF